MPTSTDPIRGGKERGSTHRFWREVILLAFLGWMCSGCDVNPGIEGSSGPSRAGFRRVDSASIEITTTDDLLATAPMAWEVDPLPSLVIGAGQSSSDDLYQIRGVRGLGTGSILVVNGGSRELRFYDFNGRLHHTAGGRGEGPGEFQDPRLLATADPDSILLWDTRLRRLQGFTPDGQGHWTVPIHTWPRGAGSRPPIGAIRTQLLIAKRPIMAADYAQTPGAKRDTVNYVWLDPARGTETHVVAFPDVRNFVLRRLGAPPGMVLIPFTVPPLATVWNGGGLFSDGRNFEIREFDHHGTPTRVFRVAKQGRPTTRSMIEGMIELKTSQPGSSSRGFLEDLYDKMPIPDTIPAFQSLKVDSEGWVWARMYEWDPAEPGVWLVFDPDGRARGSIQTPQGLTVEWIGTDLILGVWTDSMDVEQVRGYPLRRGDSQTSDAPSGSRP